MTATTLDERLHADAVKAAIKAQFGPNNVYDYGKVPGADGNSGTLPNIFALVSIERMYNANVNMAAKAGATGWRVSIRGLGRTVDEARWALAKITLALNEVRLMVDGRPTTPIQYESGQAPASDDGRQVGSSQWTYYH